MSTTTKEERRAQRAAAAAQASYLRGISAGVASLREAVAPAQPSAQPCPG
jgi:hypothetical protein